ncbi:Vacuolar protein sorting-associated protein 51 [Allomyces javanicus]|nr:Vacuolar protein sorting-associated protein 51 [Allomyces javanicus]
MAAPTASVGSLRRAESASPAGSDGSGTVPRRANRLLRDYYQLGATSGSVSPGESGGDAAPVQIGSRSSPALNQVKRNDATDLASETFDVEKTFKILINEKSLPGLLKRDNELITEMKQIDGERKTLVYENYTKLIDASSTIRRMRENVENIEQEMAKLSQQVQDITGLATNLHGTFTHRKSQVHRLKVKTALLRRLQVLYALPTRLAQSVKDGSYLRAVQFYWSTKPILDRLRGTPIVDQIATEAQAAVDQIRATMIAKVSAKDVTYPQLVEYVKVLVAIGEDSASILDMFFAGAEQMITVALREHGDWLPMASAVWDDFHRLCPVEPDPTTPFTLALTADQHAAATRRLHGVATQSFRRWETTALLPLPTVTEQIAAHSEFQQRLTTAPALAPILTPLTARSLTDRLVAHFRAQAQHGVDAVHDALTDPDRAATAAAHGMQSLLDEYAAVAHAVGAVGQATCDLHAVFPNYVDQLLVAPPVTPADNITTLAALPPLVSAAGLPALVQIHVARVIADGELTPLLLAALGTPAADTVAHAVAESAAAAQDRLLQHWVVSTARRLAGHVRRHMAVTAWMAHTHPKTVAKHWIDWVAAVIRVDHDLARAIPPSRHTDGMSTPRSASVESGSVRSIPRAPRGSHRHNYSGSSAASLVGAGEHRRSYSNASAFAAAAAGGQGSLSAAGSHAGSTSGGLPNLTPAERAQLMGVGKLFAERTQYYASVPPDLDRACILVVVVRIAVKAWVEAVRELTLGKFGFQQVLIDVEYVRQRLMKGIVKDLHVSELLDEVVTSAYRRCVDPVFLSREAISGILGAVDTIEDDGTSPS